MPRTFNSRTAVLRVSHHPGKRLKPQGFVLCPLQPLYVWRKPHRKSRLLISGDMPLTSLRGRRRIHLIGYST